MSKHTPGPWDFSWHIQPNGCPTVGHKGLMVCMVAHSAKDRSQKEEALANAALISAAPDLLAALEAFERIKDIWLPVEAEEQHAEEMYALRMARNNMIAAIARAKGEPQ